MIEPQQFDDNCNVDNATNSDSSNNLLGSQSTESPVSVTESEVEVTVVNLLDENVESNNTHCTAVANSKCNTLSELENTIAHKDDEINKLTKLTAKYERLLEKANKYNEDLRNELSLLSSELHKHRIRNFENKSLHTQVTEAEIEEAYGNKPMPEWGADSGEGSGELSISDSLKAAAEAELQNQLVNTTNCPQLESDQQNAHTDSEYVFDETSGFYYHSSTGYYWDPNVGMFYDCTTGAYYQYNDQTGEYEMYSQVDLTGPSQMISENQDSIEKIKSKENKHSNRIKSRESCSKNAKRKLKKNIKSSLSDTAKHRRKLTKEKVQTDGIIDCDFETSKVVEKMKQKEVLEIEHNCEENYEADIVAEADETNDSDSESSGSLATGESELMSELESGELTSESSSSDMEILGVEAMPVSYESQTEMAQDYPPCIRVIVQSSEHLKCGSLYIVTCTGGSIGRDKNKGHAIEINDVNVSKLHAEIAFDYERNCYTLSDKGSQNGTILNGNRLSQNKSESDCYDLHHDDILQIGSTTLLMHIHKGLETCDSCEPGQVQAKLKTASSIKNNYIVLSQDEKNRQRRKELKNIKKKYGLQNSYFENPGAIITNPDLCDKAYLRRQFIGSDSEHFKQHVTPASVQSPISAQNKGHKLLAKMGWKEGQGLGKNSSGIAEPINVEMRVNQSAGLGSGTDVSLSLDNVQHAGKAKRWAQARKRYEKLDVDDTTVPASVSSVKTLNISENEPHSKHPAVQPGFDSKD